MNEEENKLAGKRCTMLVFDDRLDKVLAAFILGKTALDKGMEVDFYFAFWGLNVIRKDKLYNPESSSFQKLLGIMCPRGFRQLPTSRFNFMGMGPLMLGKMMKDQNAPSLGRLINGCLDDGARFWSCKLSREVMGYELKDLMDGVKEGTAVDFLERASDADISLFI